MSVIVVVLPKLEDAKKIRKILAGHGFQNVVACASASLALSTISGYSYGLVISGYHLKDMYYLELLDQLPQYFEMVLMGKACGPGQFQPFFQGKHMMFFAVDHHAEDDLIEDGGGAFHEVEVADGNGVEAARTDCDFHSGFSSRKKVVILIFP